MKKIPPRKAVLPLEKGEGVPRRLKDLQKKAGITQTQLAMQLGVTFAALNRWINGHAKPRQAALSRIDALEKGADIAANPTRAWDYEAAAYQQQATATPQWHLERKLNYGLAPGERLSALEVRAHLPRLRIAPERRAFLELLIT